MSINKAIITGNLTREPELRRTQGGLAVLSLGVAVNDRKRNPQSGEWEDYANFVDCTILGKRAEALSNSLHKGQKVAIEGKLHWSQWTAKDGQKRSKLEVTVDEMEFMTAKRADDEYRNPSTSTSGPMIEVEASVYDDDSPF